MFASEIQQQRDSLDLEAKPPERELELDADDNVSLFQPISSTAAHQGVIAGDINLSAEELLRAENVKLANRETAKLRTLDVAMILRQAGMTVAAAPRLASTQPTADLTARLKSLLTRNARVASAIAFKWALEHRNVNIALNNLVGIKSVRTVSDVAVLERRLALALDWYQSGEMRQATNA
jgi:hypothetical protein